MCDKNCCRFTVNGHSKHPVVTCRLSRYTMVPGGSTSCLPRSKNCISCFPRWPFQVYHLRPELWTPNMTSWVPRLVRNCISCIERYGCTKCPTTGRFLHSFIVLYCMHNYMHTYRIVEWYRQYSCYILLRSNVYTLIFFFGEEDRHIMFLISPISSYCYDLVKTLSVCGKCFNAVTLAVPNTWPRTVLI